MIIESGGPAAEAPSPSPFARFRLLENSGAGPMNGASGQFNPPNTAIPITGIALLGAATGAGGGAGTLVATASGRIVRNLAAVGVGAAFSRQLPASCCAPLVTLPGTYPRQRLQIDFAMGLPTLPCNNGHETGFFMQGNLRLPGAGGTDTMYTLCWGIVANGAGGWAFVARRTGAETLNIPLPVSFPVNDPDLRNVFSVVIVPPTDAEAAKVEVYSSGELRHTESFDGGNLPTLAEIGTAFDLGFSFFFANVVAAAVASHLQYAGIEVTVTPVE